MGTWDGRHTLSRYTRWAHGFLQQVNRTIRRLHRVASGSILRLQDRCQFQLDDSFHGFRTICRATTTLNPTQPQCKKKQKPGRISCGQPVFKYGVEVPKNTCMLRNLMLSMATPCGKRLTKRKLHLSYLSAVSTSTHQIANQAQINSLLS